MGLWLFYSRFPFYFFVSVQDRFCSVGPSLLKGNGPCEIWHNWRGGRKKLFEMGGIDLNWGGINGLAPTFFILFIMCVLQLNASCNLQPSLQKRLWLTNINKKFLFSTFNGFNISRSEKIHRQVFWKRSALEQRFTENFYSKSIWKILVR